MKSWKYRCVSISVLLFVASLNLYVIVSPFIKDGSRQGGVRGWVGGRRRCLRSFPDAKECMQQAFHVSINKSCMEAEPPIFEWKHFLSPFYSKGDAANSAASVMMMGVITCLETHNPRLRLCIHPRGISTVITAMSSIVQLWRFCVCRIAHSVRDAV